MVSNWFLLISSSKWGNSNVTTPFDFNNSATPSVKSFISGTCAYTLLPIIRSAFFPSA